MAFIGIIADSKYETDIKRVLDDRLNRKFKEHTVIGINAKSIENIKNIKFETILVMDLEDVKDKEECVSKLFESTKYLVINSDMESSFEAINNMKLNIITFGFNSKSTITASSVEENFLICLQRNIIDISGKTIEPQEFKFEIFDKKLSSRHHNLMGIASILLIYGKSEIFF